MEGAVFVIVLVQIVKSSFNMRTGSLVEIFRSKTCGKRNGYWFADHKEIS